MPFKLTSLYLVGLAAVATAAPTAGNITCDGWYLIEKWGKIVAQPTWTGFGEFKGCQTQEDGLVKRADYDTSVEPGDGSLSYETISGQEPVYVGIWGQIDDICQETFCRADESTTYTGPNDEMLTLTLDGNFADIDLRNNFITLVQNALWQATTNTSMLGGESITNTFPSYIHATTTYGDASGYYLTMQLSEPANQPGCGQFTDLLTGLGSSLPELGPVFGIIQALCENA